MPDRKELLERLRADTETMAELARVVTLHGAFEKGKAAMALAELVTKHMEALLSALDEEWRPASRLPVEGEIRVARNGVRWKFFAGTNVGLPDDVWRPLNAKGKPYRAGGGPWPHWMYRDEAEKYGLADPPRSEIE